MRPIADSEQGWKIEGGGVVLEVSRKTGCLAGLTIRTGKDFVWTRYDGDVTVRDDRLAATFGRARLRAYP